MIISVLCLVRNVFLLLQISRYIEIYSRSSAVRQKDLMGFLLCIGYSSDAAGKEVLEIFPIHSLNVRIRVSAVVAEFKLMRMQIILGQNRTD